MCWHKHYNARIVATAPRMVGYAVEMKDMNIIEALEQLEINGPGKIFRGGYEVKIFRWSTDPWPDFLKHRATLNIGDLVAQDWHHEKDIPPKPDGCCCGTGIFCAVCRLA